MDTLMKYGADIKQANEDGSTALHVACMRDLPEIVDFILSKDLSALEM